MIEIQVDVQTKDALRALDKLAANMIVAERRTLDDLRAGIRADLAKVTATWAHKPQFVEYKTEAESGNLHSSRIRIGTNDPIFRYVDAGTRPHTIAPRAPGGRLAFRWGGPGSYAAKTFPGFIASVGGGASGPIVFRRSVRHPGTKPRRFTETILRKWQDKAQALMQRRVQQALAGMDMTKWN